MANIKKSDNAKYQQRRVQSNLNFHTLQKQSVRHSVTSDALQPHGLWPARLLCPWDFPGKKEYWSGLPLPSLRDLPTLGWNVYLLSYFCFQADFLSLHCWLPLPYKSVAKVSPKTQKIACCQSFIFQVPSLGFVSVYCGDCIMNIDANTQLW